MNFYPELQIVEIVIPFADPNGQAVVPTAITAVMKDGEENVIIDFGPLSFDNAGVETRVVIPALYNTLQGDELQEVRRLEVEITHAGGSFRVAKAYVIEAEQSLQIMRNSFMTYDTALMLSAQFVNLQTFVNASDERRRAALSEAYFRITTLPMIYSITDTDGMVDSSYSINQAVWPLITVDTFQTQFPTHFKRALRSAQLVEADDLLQGNVLARKHAQGIATETVGESSVTLRKGFGGGLDAGIGSAALALLSGYIDRTIRIGRA